MSSLTIEDLNVETGGKPMEGARRKHFRKKNARLYQYVGPERLRLAVAGCPIGVRIASLGEIENWMSSLEREPNAAGLMPASFVVDLNGHMRVADSNSEHIAVAGGMPVLAAGKIFFGTGDRSLEVVEITNQATGFCPEPKSWEAVAKAIEKVPLSHPGKFTSEYVYRRCESCGELNVVKGNLFICDFCNASLPKVWNCSRPPKLD
ncbi:MAG: hypothetical protein F6J93_00835 [Oscillatoria sp. SIO1A7]|nr:hypothetical protein [Oscillatoria sp. SIO1A7]